MRKRSFVSFEGIRFDAFGMVCSRVPFDRIELFSCRYFFWDTVHGDAHEDLFTTRGVVFWFLQVEEQGIIFTHDLII